MGQVFINDVPIDDESPYFLHWDSTKFGKLEKREPAIIQTAGGIFAVAPLATAVKERRGSVGVYAAAIDNLDKWRVESDIRALLSGAKQLHIGSRYLNLTFTGGDEPEDGARRAGNIAGARADFVAPDPYWYLNQPLAGLGTPVNIGDEWAIYDDNSVPTLIPIFIFATNSFTINNWGNAPTFAAGTVTNGPASTTIYLKGVAGSSARLAVVLNGSGAGSFLASEELRLDPGDNAITVETAGGSLQAVSGSFSINFGNTYMRFH